VVEFDPVAGAERLEELPRGRRQAEPRSGDT
jgi:hypothetical protein